MNKFLLLLLLLLLFLCGCASEPIYMEMDEDFTSDEMFLIKKAGQEWKAATDSVDGTLIIYDTFETPEPFTIEQWDESDYRIFKVGMSDPGYQDLLDMWKGNDGITPLGGYQNDNNIALIVEAKNYNNGFLSTTLHEIGHMFHMSHARNGLMNTDTNLYCIDLFTLNDFCDDNDCGPDAHPTCVK